MKPLFDGTRGYLRTPHCALRRVIIRPKWWERWFLRRKVRIVDATEPWFRFKDFTKTEDDQEAKP